MQQLPALLARMEGWLKLAPECWPPLAKAIARQARSAAFHSYPNGNSLKWLTYRGFAAVARHLLSATTMSNPSSKSIPFLFVPPSEGHAITHRPLPSPRLGKTTRFTARVLALAACLVGCGPSFDLPNSDADEVVELGQTAFALTADAANKSYALRDAQFTITGSETFSLDSNDEPDATTLTLDLPAGPYAVELAEGFKLVEVTSAGDVEVQATLETPNPQSILVSPEQTTTVTYVFRTAGEPVSFGPGTLAVAIAVEQTESPGLVISEFMVNPSAVSDTAGEWLEIANTSGSPVSLDGCRILRDGSGFTIEGGITVPANGFLTVANGASPGFTPGYVYSGVTLPNSAAFTLSLECAGSVVDSLSVEPSAWPLASGISAALDLGALSSTQNDAPSAWCLSTKSYGVDFGTPGSANDACTP